MPENQQTPEVLADGGFRIEISPDQVDITADPKAWKRQTKSQSRIWFGHFFVFIVWSVAAFRILPQFIALGSAGLWVLLGLVCYIFAISRFDPNFNLHCTREYIEVIRIRRGKILSRNTYLQPEITKVRYVPISYSKSGAALGIVFQVAGKKIKTMRRLECIEGDRILTELHRLGYDTVFDVTLALRVQLARQRREKK